MYQVLVTDDEEIERRALARKIKRYFGESCEVLEAENGTQAIRIVNEKEVPIVIMDIGLPGIDGVTAAERIRKEFPCCVIIFLTAYDEFSYAKRAVSIHALEYLLKPCEAEELIPVMEEAMRQVDICRKDTASQKQDKESVYIGGRCIEGDGGHEGAEKAGTRVAAAIRDYVMENYNKDISMQDAARAMNYSEVYFCRLFKQCFDQNFTAYLTHLRIREAKRLLRDPRANIKEVSRKVGYSDSNYFSRLFKRITGQLPSEYRDRESVAD